MNDSDMDTDGTNIPTSSDVRWRLLVGDDADFPPEVVQELRSFAASAPPTGQRAFVADALANAVGGLITAGTWDGLPLYAAHVLRRARKPAPASADTIVERTLQTLAAAGVIVPGSPAAVTSLVHGPGDAWTGRVEVNDSVVTFVASVDGSLLAYQTVE